MNPKYGLCKWLCTFISLYVFIHLYENLDNTVNNIKNFWGAYYKYRFLGPKEENFWHLRRVGHR